MTIRDGAARQGWREVSGGPLGDGVGQTGVRVSAGIGCFGSVLMPCGLVVGVGVGGGGAALQTACPRLKLEKSEAAAGGPVQ